MGPTFAQIWAASQRSAANADFTAAMIQSIMQNARNTEARPKASNHSKALRSDGIWRSIGRFHPAASKIERNDSSAALCGRRHADWQTRRQTWWTTVRIRYKITAYGRYCSQGQRRGASDGRKRQSRISAGRLARRNISVLCWPILWSTQGVQLVRLHLSLPRQCEVNRSQSQI